MAQADHPCPYLDPNARGATLIGSSRRSRAHSRAAMPCVVALRTIECPCSPPARATTTVLTGPVWLSTSSGPSPPSVVSPKIVVE